MGDYVMDGNSDFEGVSDLELSDSVYSDIIIDCSCS